jgi:signal transduction histidine kinase
MAALPYLFVGYLMVRGWSAVSLPLAFDGVALFLGCVAISLWVIRAPRSLRALIVAYIVQSGLALTLWSAWPAAQGWVLVTWSVGSAASRLPLSTSLPLAIGAFVGFVGSAVLLPNGETDLGGNLLGPSILFAAVLIIGEQRRRQRAYLRQLEVLLAERERYLAQLEEAHHQLQIESLQAAALAAAEERNRIAREIHDVLAHSLTTIVIQAQALKRLISTDPAAAADHAETVARLARDGLNEARRSVAALRADADTPAGLSTLRSLVEEFARNADVQTRFYLEGELVALPPNVWTTLYRITQEALTNARRHGQARNVEVRLSPGPPVRLVVEDDGTADPSRPTILGNGLTGMVERAARLGGTLAYGPRPEGGFCVDLELPK